MQTSSRPIIEIKNVSKYFGEKTALDHVNLYVRKGEFLTILGPSGCGKTTLLRLLAGFQTASEGEIYIGGNEVKENAPCRYGTESEGGIAHGGDDRLRIP